MSGSKGNAGSDTSPGSEFDEAFAILASLEGPLPASGGTVTRRLAPADVKRLAEIMRTLAPERTAGYLFRSDWRWVLADRYTRATPDVALAAFRRHLHERELEGPLTLWSRAQQPPFGDSTEAALRKAERRLERMDALTGSPGVAAMRLQVIARCGDVEAYRALRPRVYRVRRAAATSCASILIAEVARRRGFDEALQLSTQPGMRAPVGTVIGAALGAATAAEVDSWFDAHPEHDAGNRRLTELFAAFMRDPVSEAARRASLIGLVAAAEWDKPKSQRDWMLMHLATARPMDADAMQRVRSLIRTPEVKRELRIAFEELREASA